MDVCSYRSAAKRQDHHAYTNRLLCQSQKKYKRAGLVKTVVLLSALLGAALAWPFASFANVAASASSAASVSIFVSTTGVLTSADQVVDALIVDSMSSFSEEKRDQTFYFPSDASENQSTDDVTPSSSIEAAPAVAPISLNTATQTWHERLGAVKQSLGSVWHTVTREAKSLVQPLKYPKNQTAKKHPISAAASAVNTSAAHAVLPASSAASVFATPTTSIDTLVLEAMLHFSKDKLGLAFYRAPNRSLQSDVKDKNRAVSEAVSIDKASPSTSTNNTPILRDRFTAAQRLSVSIWHTATQNVKQWVHKPVRPEVQNAKTQNAPIASNVASLAKLDISSSATAPIISDSATVFATPATLVDGLVLQEMAQFSEGKWGSAFYLRSDASVSKNTEAQFQSAPIKPVPALSNIPATPTADAVATYASSIDALVLNVMPGFFAPRLDSVFYFPVDASIKPDAYTQTQPAPTEKEAAALPAFAPANAPTWRDRFAPMQHFVGVIWQNTMHSAQYLGQRIAHVSAQAAKSASQTMKAVDQVMQQNAKSAYTYFQFRVKPWLASYVAQVRGMYERDPVRVGILGAGAAVGLGLMGSGVLWYRQRKKHKQGLRSTEQQTHNENETADASENALENNQQKPSSKRASKKTPKSKSAAHDIDKLVEDLASWLNVHPPVTMQPAVPKRPRRKKQAQPIQSAESVPEVLAVQSEEKESIPTTQQVLDKTEDASEAPTKKVQASTKNPPSKQLDIEEKQVAELAMQHESDAKAAKEIEPDAESTGVIPSVTPKAKATKKRPQRDIKEELSTPESKSNLAETAEHESVALLDTRVEQQEKQEKTLRPFKVIRAFTPEAAKPSITRPVRRILVQKEEETEVLAQTADTPSSVDLPLEPSDIGAVKPRTEADFVLPADESEIISDLKLELAKAYSNMGEIEGARTLLEEASHSESKGVAQAARTQLAALSASQVKPKSAHAEDA